MTRATLLALADRVEALTGPCRETDAEICRAIGWRNRDGFWWEPAEVEIARKKRQSIYGFPSYGKSIPGYTASLDAAMTLVPDGGRWFKCGVNDPITNAAQTRMFVCGPQDDEGRFQVSGECLTDETAHGDCLALTAAALRARAMMETNHE